MRFALACLLALPTGALAESFTLPSRPTEVTIHAGEALVTRTLRADVPAGSHELVLPGLPRGLSPDRLRVSMEGAQLTATQFRATAVPPQPDRDSDAVRDARARVREAEQAIKALDARIEEVRLAAKAAEARAGFLADLGGNAGLPSDAETLRALSRMVGEETLAARQAALEAEQAAQAIEEGREDLEKALEEARAALAALTPPAEEAAQLTLSVQTPTSSDVAVSISYAARASWVPVYDITLTTEDPTQLQVKRGALISQSSGENWDGVAVTLSTLQPSLQTAPSKVWPRPRRIGDPEPPQPVMRQFDQSMGAAKMQMEAAPMVAEPVVVARTDGPGVRYEVSAPLTLASGVDASRVTLDTLEFDARRFARAAPAYDSTAFMMAEFTNTTQEPLLASGDAAFYVDNTLVGRGNFDAVPAGDEGEVAFGPIEDLLLDYTVLDEAESNRGIINRSNAMRERRRLTVENLGQQDWDVEVQDAVPYAVQEDLEIEWTASPMPDVTDVEDQRGVLQWTLNVPAGEAKEITLSQELNWPEGKVLR